jgi:hypothetical protein
MRGDTARLIRETRDIRPLVARAYVRTAYCLTGRPMTPLRQSGIRLLPRATRFIRDQAARLPACPLVASGRPECAQYLVPPRSRTPFPGLQGGVRAAAAECGARRDACWEVMDNIYYVNSFSVARWLAKVLQPTEGIAECLREGALKPNDVFS